MTYTAGCFDKMVIAGASTILGRGLIERATGIHIYWSLWFFAFLPCVLITIFFIWRLVLWLYPPEKTAHEGVGAYLDDALAKMGPWTSAEKRAMILMLLAIGLWMTDLLHHISPAVIGIGAGLLALTPGLGLLDQEDLKRYNFLPMLFVAAAISMGDVLVQTRALDALTGVMFSWMRPFTTQRGESGAGALLDCVLLSHLSRERAFDAGHVHSSADELRENQRPSSLAAGHGLGVCRRRENLRVPVRRFGGRDMRTAISIRGTCFALGCG